MKDLFGNEIIEPITEKRKTNQAAINAHAKFIHVYGKVKDKCKNCMFFETKQYSGTYFKCIKFKTSNSQSSDWRANWNACGLFKQKTD